MRTEVTPGMAAIIQFALAVHQAKNDVSATAPPKPANLTALYIAAKTAGIPWGLAMGLLHPDSRAVLANGKDQGHDLSIGLLIQEAPSSLADLMRLAAVAHIDRITKSGDRLDLEGVTPSQTYKVDLDKIEDPETLNPPAEDGIPNRN